MPELYPHPAHVSWPAVGFCANARELRNGDLLLAFRLRGALHDLWLPPPASPTRGEALWRRTCFEAFVANDGRDDYREFHVAPSGQWAALSFRDYRQPAPDGGLGAAPAIRIRRAPEGLLMRLRLGATLLPLPRAPSGWRIGLTAVLEATDGTLTYWALRHASSTPDFHRRESFILRCPRVPLWQPPTAQ